jgi:hypothetical protein
MLARYFVPYLFFSTWLPVADAELFADLRGPGIVTNQE